MDLGRNYQGWGLRLNLPQDSEADTSYLGVIWHITGKMFGWMIDQSGDELDGILEGPEGFFGCSCEGGTEEKSVHRVSLIAMIRKRLWGSCDL